LKKDDTQSKIDDIHQQQQ